MLTQSKPNYCLFIICTVIYTIVNVIFAVYIVCGYFSENFDILSLACIMFVVWQFVHIGLCCYFYFTGNQLPLGVKIYFYIDMGIFGMLVLYVIVVVIESMIVGCHDDSSYFPTCFIAVLLCIGSFATSLGYGGCNVLLAYCVFQVDKMELLTPECQHEMKPIKYSNILNE